jgi:hypothetical protein
MTAKNSYVPSMSDQVVKDKTQKDWSGWFDTLDREGAARMDHKAIVRVLSDKHGVPSWWRQMVAVEYERSRGLRVLHQTAAGYSVAISKTLAASICHVYSATSDATRRGRWFPEGQFVPTSMTQDKYCRGTWNVTARLEFGFSVKGDNKSQISVQVSRLPGTADVDVERAAWKAAFARLQTVLEKRSAPSSAG